MRVRLPGNALKRLGTWAWNAVFVVGVATIGGAALVTWLSRIKARGLHSRPDPALDYVGALDRLERMAALDDDRISPVCRTRGLLHGRPTEQVVILVHGLTNCARQWAPFGDLLYQRGCNVLLARMPRHGFRDRMTTEPSHLRAEELRDYADRIVDIAAGLG